METICPESEATSLERVQQTNASRVGGASSAKREELNNIKDVWNAHRIRPTSNPNVPHGIPNVMYSTPELWDTEDCAMPLDQEELDVSKGQCVFRSCVPCDEDIFDLCMILVEELGLQFPSKSPLEAIDLYLTLRNAINTELRDG
ncbi:hypothetical protein ABVT39_000448 [Epinephelus coioides]